jgi:hypothetical protein
MKKYHPLVKAPGIQLKRIIGLLCLLFISTIHAGYAMQPPPPPLNIAKLKNLVAVADDILIGSVSQIQETQQMIDGRSENKITVTLKIEKRVKGKEDKDQILIEEIYPAPPSLPASGGAEGKQISAMRAGPSPYHGKFSSGARMVLFLKRPAESSAYHLLGSGTYTEYIGEFLLENGKVSPLYVSFAEDLILYADSESQFIGLIERLLEAGQ